MANTPYKARKVLFDKKLSLIAYAVTLVAAVIARTNQLKTNMNFATGKYIDPSAEKNTPFWILVIGIAVISFILIFGKSKDKAIKSCILVNPMRLRAEKLNKKIPNAAGLLLFLMAGLISFDIILALATVASKNLEISTDDNPVFIFAGIPAMDWSLYLCEIVVVVTFITMGINIIKGDGLSKGNCVFLMFYPLWKLLECLNMLSANQLAGARSEDVYILLTAISSSMFFIYAARLFGGYEKRNTRIGMCILGYVTSLFGAVSVIPRYIAFFIMTYHERAGMATPKTADLGVAAVTVAMVCVFWTTYVYRVMPKLSFSGKRRWMKTTLTASTMETLDKDTGETK